MKTIRELRNWIDEHEDFDNTDMVKWILYILFAVGTFDHVLIDDKLFEQSIALIGRKRQ